MDEPHIDGYPLWSGMPPPEPRIHYEGPVEFSGGPLGISKTKDGRGPSAGTQG